LIFHQFKRASNDEPHQFRTLIHQLCKNAPEAAQAIAVTIQESNNSNPEEQAMPDTTTSHSIRGKRKADKDPSYRPPKSAKVKAAKSISPDSSDQPSDECETHSGQATIVTRKPPPNADGNIAEDGKHPGDDELLVRLSSQLVQSISRDDNVLERENTTDGRDTMETTGGEDTKANTETIGITSASSEAGKPQRKVSAESMLETVLPPGASAKMIPVTPTKLTDGEPTSPETEEIRRDKIPTSLESISSSPQSISDSSSTEITPLMDLILQAVRVIHQFSKYPHGTPKGVHARILQSLRRDQVIAASNCNQWSDGSMWMQVLEMGSSENNKVTVLNMLEYMGAWEWYDSQIKLAQSTIRTKKNKPVDHRGAAIHVLNNMQGLQTDAARRGRWISGVGRVTLEGDESNLLPESGDIGITERDRQLQRKRISIQLSRGQKLSTKLVKELGFGILFSTKIW
jgi:hypothetical protein